MIRALLLAKYGPLAASTRHRFVRFEPFLRAAGIDLRISPLLNDDVIRGRASGRRGVELDVARAYLHRLAELVRARRYDVVVIQYELFPFIPPGFERLLELAGVRYVVDYDDAIFHQYDHHARRAVRAVLGNKIRTVMRHAHTVIVGNRYLEAEARRWNRRVCVIPTVVDTDHYVPRRTPLPADGPFTIGWIGSPSTAPYLDMVAGPLDRFAGARAARFLCVGGRAPSLRRMQVEERAWAEARELPDLQDLDVGIMPLPDTLWARGKCAFKLIQYMACGLPVICSPVGANRDVVRNGIDGVWADDDDAWVRAMEELAIDRPARARMGAAGRERVVREFSLNAMAPKLAEVLRRAADPS